MTTTVPTETKTDLAPLPKESEDEERRALALAQENVARLALVDPTKVETLIKARESSLELLGVACIRRTNAYDWTLYKDKDGREVAVLRDSGAVNVRKLMGISIFNYRPTEHGYPTPLITSEQQPDGSKLTVVEMWADGICGLTGESVEGVYIGLRSDDDFIGRERKDHKGGEFVSAQDMKAACRTSLDAKVTRILSGLRKVPVERLKDHGIKVEQCHRGRGYGTSSERGASRVAEAGVPERVAKLKDEILRVVGGDIQALKEVSLAITKSPDGKFRGFDSLDRLGKDWQVDAAEKTWAKHPLNQGEAKGSRDPGAEG